MGTRNALLWIALAFVVFFMRQTDVVADILFQDDFEQDAIGEEPEKWDYDPDSEVTDVGEVDEDPFDPGNQVLTNYGGYLADNGAEYTDFVAEWDWMFYLDDGRNNSVGFRVQGPSGNYQLSRRGGGLDWNLYMFDGAWVLLDSNVYPTEIDTWYRVHVSAMGEDFIVKAKEKEDETPFADLDPILDVSDDTYESGYFSTSYWGPIDNVIIADTEEDIINAGGDPELKAGDADRDFDFDQLDLVQVQIAAKYLTRQPATWGEGDWNGAPGGTQQEPPAGDGFFDQLDIIAALNANTYLKGPYWPPQFAAVGTGGKPEDGQTSVVYDARTGEVAIDAPPGIELTSVNIDSASGIFTGDNPANLTGSFDTHDATNIFKATFGSSFGSLSFGNVAVPSLSEDFIASDLSVIGSLAGGGGLGDVDLVYIPVPEPTALVLAALGIVSCILPARRRRTC